MTLALNPGGASLAPFVRAGFKVTLDPVGNASGGYAVAKAPNNVATVTVIDDDAPVLSISAGAPAIEGSGTGATFNVTATNSPNAKYCG